GSSNDWIAPLQNPLSPPLPDSIDTTTIINAGPEFLAYLVESGGAPQATEVLSLQNGCISGTEPIPESFFRMQKAGGGFQTNADGKSPAGPNSLLTFLPLTADFDQATSITLHRYLDNSVLKPVSDFPVATIAVNDGYDTST